MLRCILTLPATKCVCGKDQDLLTATSRVKKKKQEGNTLEWEILFCQFVAEHNLSSSIAHHFTDLVRRMFMDSKTAVNFMCKKTKTTKVIKGSLAQAYTEPITERCQRGPLSLMIDESNGKNKKAKNPCDLPSLFISLKMERYQDKNSGHAINLAQSVSEPTHNKVS